MEPFEIACPHCSGRLRVTLPKLVGRNVSCPCCEKLFRVARPSPAEEVALNEEAVVGSGSEIGKSAHGSSLAANGGSNVLSMDSVVMGSGDPGLSDLTAAHAVDGFDDESGDYQTAEYASGDHSDIYTSVEQDESADQVEVYDQDESVEEGYHDPSDDHSDGELDEDDRSYDEDYSYDEEYDDQSVSQPKFDVEDDENASYRRGSGQYKSTSGQYNSIPSERKKDWMPIIIGGGVPGVLGLIAIIIALYMKGYLGYMMGETNRRGHREDGKRFQNWAKNVNASDWKPQPPNQLERSVENNIDRCMRDYPDGDFRRFRRQFFKVKNQYYREQITNQRYQAALNAIWQELSDAEESHIQELFAEFDTF